MSVVTWNIFIVFLQLTNLLYYQIVSKLIIVCDKIIRLCFASVAYNVRTVFRRPMCVCGFPRYANF